MKKLIFLLPILLVGMVGSSTWASSPKPQKTVVKHGEEKDKELASRIKSIEEHGDIAYKNIKKVIIKKQ